MKIERVSCSFIFKDLKHELEFTLFLFDCFVTRLMLTQLFDNSVNILVAYRLFVFAVKNFSNVGHRQLTLCEDLNVAQHLRTAHYGVSILNEQCMIVLHHHAARTIICKSFLTPFKLDLDWALVEIPVFKLDSLENFVRPALPHVAAKTKHCYKASLIASNVIFLKLYFEKQS
jgi:hypothetical protein